ncbi:MAG: metal-dependent hydrolase [Gemmatimonadaceae bacterium]|nr:metal-dependent hydrolase [Gemmatimonadaceae bacterium]
MSDLLRRSLRTFSLGVFLGVTCLPAVAVAQRARAAISVQWLGHATFEVVSSGGTRILIDPFLTDNPATPDSLKALSRYKPSAILVSHSHFDHSVNARAIAVASGAPVISIYEWVATLGLPEAQAKGGNVGGTFKVGDVTIHLVPAMHSSEPGHALGFVLEFADGRSLYHTGDTWLFSEMSLIQELYHPSIILLGTGGGPYTQGPAAAKLAVRKFFTPATIVPMHYGTFPGLATAAEVRAAWAGDKRVVMMMPGDRRAF